VNRGQLVSYEQVTVVHDRQGFYTHYMAERRRLSTVVFPILYLPYNGKNHEKIKFNKNSENEKYDQCV